MWGVKRAPLPDDSGQAQDIAKDARRELAELKAQSSEVESMLRKLARRREQNHFGRDLTVTFKRRAGNA